MWGEHKSGPQAAEASGTLFCSPHIMMSYTNCVSITEQTTAKSYLFILYNKKKNPELNRQMDNFLSTQTFGNLN
jgi:hypothetical protein